VECFPHLPPLGGEANWANLAADFQENFPLRFLQGFAGNIISKIEASF
jgi:hypothetical protein